MFQQHATLAAGYPGWQSEARLNKKQKQLRVVVVVAGVGGRARAARGQDRGSCSRAAGDKAERGAGMPLKRACLVGLLGQACGWFSRAVAGPGAYLRTHPLAATSRSRQPMQLCRRVTRRSTTPCTR